MKNTKRDFNGAAHFFLGLSLACVAMTIVSNSINISNYNYFGWNSSILIKEIVIDALILGAGVLTFMKKKSGLIALVILFIVRMFVTIPWNSDTSTAYLLGGKTADLFRDFAPFAIAMCFKKNGISGWKSMLASEEYVIAHTIMKERIDEPIDEQTVDESSPNGQDDEQHKPKEESEVFQPTIVENEQDQGAGIEAHVEEKPQVAAFPVSEERIDEKKTLIRPKTSLSKVAKVCIASIIGIIAVCAGIAIIVATKSYPDYISSFGDKWKYTFNQPNDRLVKELVEKAQPTDDGLFYVFTHPVYNSQVLEPEKFYRVRVDALREISGCTFYKTIGVVKKPEELIEDRIYVSSEDGEIETLDDKEDIRDIKEYWEKNQTLDGEIIYKTQKYDCGAAIKEEVSLFDKAATIPVADIKVIDLVGGYFEKEGNYSKASDYYQFLLKKHPRNSAIRGRLAYALYMSGDNEEARVAAEKALGKDPKEISALAALALIEADEFNWGEVKKYARKAIDYGSENSNVYYAYCEALYKQGEIKAAHQYYNKAFEFHRRNPRREKYSEYAGCPFDIVSIDIASEKGGETNIPYGEKLYSSKLYYITTRITANYLRFEDAEIGVKIYENGKLSTGTGSKNGYSFTRVIDGDKPGEHTIRVGGWGSDSQGAWSRGSYSVEIWYKGEKIGEEEFRVY